MKSAWDVLEAELASMSDAHQALTKALDRMRPRVVNDDLRNAIDDTRSTVDDQASRLEEALHAIGAERARATCKPVAAMLSTFSADVRSAAPAVVDLRAAQTVLEVIEYLSSASESAAGLARRAGAEHSVPTLGDVLEAGVKPLDRVAKKLRKLVPTLIEELRPA